MEFDPKMLAYCGIYCEQCSVRSAVIENNPEHLKDFPAKFKVDATNLSAFECEGCKGKNLCGPCKIKDCAAAKGFISCASCNDFPCSLLDSFGNDGIPHHHNALENLKNIRKIGIPAWFEELRSELRCHCGQRLSWYHACPSHPPTQ